MWQLIARNGNLCGGINLRFGLTGFFPEPDFVEADQVFSQEIESAPIRRGPHTELTDAQLHGRRDQLVQVFEGYWGQIGIALRRCKKADNLISIFSPLIESFVRELVSPLCRSLSKPVAAITPRRIRAKLRVVAKQRYDADNTYRRSSEQMQRVDAAFLQATKGNRRLVRRERKKWRKELATTKPLYQQICKMERDLDEQRLNVEARFARQQMLLFLKSKRYEVNPLSLANATAGLPYMGWRQSMRRCKARDSKIADGQSYQIFKSIRYLTKTADHLKTANKLVASFRDGIPRLPNRYRLAKTEIAKKWLYLERAIRQAVRAKPRSHALPFEITRRYFEQMRTYSHVDTVLAEQRQIPLRWNVRNASTRPLSL
jgi:hypothetical protein